MKTTPDQITATVNSSTSKPETMIPAKKFKPSNLLKFAKLTTNAFAPTRGSPLSAGYDLYAAYDAEVPVGHRVLVKTDLQISIPENTYGRVAPRSGLAYKKGIDVGAGVIDADYRGNVGVLLFNLDFMKNEVFTVKKGDRIAQLVIERIELLELEELESLDDTVRGAGGFGSTGTN